MQVTDSVSAHAGRLTALWDKMVGAIGIHTVNVLMERAIWESQERHPELALIQRSDDGLAFDALAQAYADRSAAQVSAAFDDLDSVLLLILARLLGKEMAQGLADEPEAKKPQA